jgi:hypothetical protein
MRYTSTRGPERFSRGVKAVSEIPPHHEGAIVWIVIPPIHGIVVHVKAIRHVHVGVEVFTGHVPLRGLIHVRESRKTVAPGQLAIIIDEQSALGTFAILQLPRAQGTSIYTVFLVSDDTQRRSSVAWRSEATFEEATMSRILVIPVLLDGIGFLSLPCGVLLCRLPRWKQFSAADEDTGHFSDLARKSVDLVPAC